MISEIQKIHLENLNSNPNSIATRFKSEHMKGKPAWNRQEIYIPCKICGRESKSIKSRAYKHKFCSTECKYKAKVSTLKNKIIELYNSGKKHREISEILNKPIGTIAGLVYRYQLNNRFGHPEINKTVIRRQLPNFCELCGFTRAIELAHIIPRSKGGQHRISNYLSLCPNCHFLFDQDKLTKEETEKISKVIEVRRYATSVQ